MDFYEEIAKHSPVGILLVDRNAKIKFVSGTAPTILGLSKQKILGRNVLSFIAKEDLDRAKRNFRLAFENKLKLPRIYKVKKGKKYIYCEVITSKLNEDMLIFFKDISLEESFFKKDLSEFNNILLNSPVAIVVGASDGSIKIFNKKAEKIFGISQERALKMKTWELMKLRGFKNVVKPSMMKLMYLLAIKTGLLKKRSFEVKINVNKKIKYLQFYLSITTSFNQKNVILIVNDITDLRKAEREVINTLQKLKVFNKIISVLSKSETKEKAIKKIKEILLNEYHRGAKIKIKLFDQKVSLGTKLEKDFKTLIEKEVSNGIQRILIREKIKLSELKFKGIVKSISDTIFLFDDKNKFIECYTPKAYSNFKFVKKINGRNIFISKEITRILKKSLELCKKNKPTEFYYDITIGNKKRYFNARVNPIFEKRRYKGAVVVARDITKLKEERDKLQMYINVAKLIILIVNKKGKILELNKEAEHIGIKKGKNLFDYVKNAKEEKEKFKELLTHGKCECECIIKTDKERVISWRGAITETDEVILAGEDITEKKEREKEMSELIKEREKERIKKNFLLLITHELKQPLTPILGYADLLKEEITNVTHLEYLDRIINGAEEMRGLINKIVNLMKLETGQLSFIFRPTSISEIVEDAIRKRAAMIHLKNITVKKIIKDGKFECDYNLFKTVLINLIDNAIKFSPDHSTIIIKAKPTKKYVIFSVKDFGIGIKKEDLPKLFKTFSQTEEGKKKGGFGIGLALCKMIIEKHHGTISVKSEYGKGSEFTIKIPRWQNK